MTLGARAFAPLPRALTVALCTLALGTLAVVDRQAALRGALSGHAGVVDAAATVDLTLGASLLTWWMLGRSFRWTAWSLVPLYFASLALAGAALPDGHEGALRWAHLAAAPLELVALAFLVGKIRTARRAWRGGGSASAGRDLHAALQHAAEEALGPGRFAEVVAYEASVLGYALGAGGPAADAWHGVARLSYHGKSANGAIVFALLLATSVEVVGVHFLVSLWSHRAAWILTGLGIYGALWIFGDWRACRLRPVEVEGGVLRIRFGLRWRLDVPLDALRVVRAPTADELARKDSVDLRLALPGARWQVLELDRAVPAQGIYGLRRSVRTLGLAVDEPAALHAALADATARHATDHEQR